MAESKYGRLYTQADVLMLLRYAAQRGDVDGVEKLGQADGQNVDPGERLLVEYEAETRSGPFDDLPRLSFPGDEPLLLLRGRDAAAHGVAWAYAYEAHRVGASVDFVTAAMKVSNDMRDWADANKVLMVVPK